MSNVRPHKMISGHIYVLQNPAFGSYVVKIGLTKRAPDIRAREIYSGATGVPMPFDIAVAYSVGDCKEAETRIHKRLRAYRLNGRREFFRLSPAVASIVALETCSQVNESLGLHMPETVAFDSSRAPPARCRSLAGRVVDAVPDEADGRPIFWVDFKTLGRSAVGTSTLTPEQEDRARILHLNMSKVTGFEDQEWLETFTQDQRPERELRIWEHICKAFLTVDEIDIASAELKREAYYLLLQRSLMSTNEVLSRSEPRHIPLDAARRLLGSYELRPKPLIASGRRGAA